MRLDYRPAATARGEAGDESLRPVGPIRSPIRSKDRGTLSLDGVTGAVGVIAPSCAPHAMPAQARYRRRVRNLERKAFSLVGPRHDLSDGIELGIRQRVAGLALALNADP